MPSGGKREGAGRKPGSKNKTSRVSMDSHFCSRISQRLRTMLDDAAEANGCTLSAEVHRRLELSFSDPRKNEEAMKSIEHAVSLVGPDVLALLAAQR
jgi:hypothetical protein